MGFGILAALKTLAPLSIYLIGVFLFFATFAGRIHWTLAFVTFLIPLRNVVDRLQQFPMGNKFLTILIFVMTMIWFLTAFGQRFKSIPKSSLNFISLILVAYTFFSLQIGNQYLETSIFNVRDPRVQDWKNFCMMPLLFFITLNNITDKKWVWRLLTVMCLSMLLMAYYTMTQITWFSALVSRTKISGTFQFLGPNEVAAFFNQFTLLLMSVYFFLKKGIKKTLLLILVLMNLYCILFLYSRAAYLATFIGMCLLFAVKNRKLLFILILAAVFWQTVLPEKAVERIQETTDEQGEIVDISAERRLAIWSISANLVQESPLVGIGFGSFRRLGFDLKDPHNIYLKILVEQGIFGLLIFAILILCFLKEGFILYKKGEDDLSKGLGLGLVICVVVLLINNIFGDRWSYFELSSYLWIYAGLVAKLNALSFEAAQAATKVLSRKNSKKSHKHHV